MDLFTAIVYLILTFLGYRAIVRLIKIPQISDLGSRWILITGCDTGFGNAIAKRLDSLGCNVIAACLTESGETELRKSCAKKLHTIHMDVSNPESVKKAREEVITIIPNGRGLWGLLNNAGISGRFGPSEWLNLDDYHQVTSVNLFGLIDVALTFLPFIKKEKGRIVNTASLAGRIAAATSPYAVSKYGVEAFSDQLRRDMKNFNVSVSIIEPEFFSTNMTRMGPNLQSMRETFESLPESTQKEYGREFLEEACNQVEKSIGTLMNENITPVLDAYTHALIGMFPQARYVVGRTAWLLLLIQGLPEWLGDSILKRILSHPKPAACREILIGVKNCPKI